MSSTPENKEEYELASGSESESGSGVDENLGVEDDDIDLGEFESGDEIDPTSLMVELLESTLTTPDGDTICSALVNVGRQIEMQNKILVKLLMTLKKN